MAVRIEREGNLNFYYGAPDPAGEPKRKFTLQAIAAVLVAAGAVVAGVWYFAPHAIDWPTVTLAVKTFLGVIW